MPILSFIGFIAVIVYAVKIHDKRKEQRKAKYISEYKKDLADMAKQIGRDFNVDN